MSAASDTDSRGKRFYIAGSSGVEITRNLPLSRLSQSPLPPLFSDIILFMAEKSKMLYCKTQDQEMCRICGNNGIDKSMRSSAQARISRKGSMRA